MAASRPTKQSRDHPHNHPIQPNDRNTASQTNLWPNRSQPNQPNGRFAANHTIQRPLRGHSTNQSQWFSTTESTPDQHTTTHKNQQTDSQTTGRLRTNKPSGLHREPSSQLHQWYNNVIQTQCTLCLLYFLRPYVIILLSL